MFLVYLLSIFQISNYFSKNLVNNGKDVSWNNSELK